MHEPELSVVVLFYNAGEMARSRTNTILDLLTKAHIDFELILVANFDRPDDPTPRIVAEIADGNPRIRYTAVPKQGMYGWDVKSGLQLATGRYVSFTDGDGQMPFEDLIRTYETARSGGADIVKTYRTKREDDTWRSQISYVFNFIFRVLYPGSNIKDVNAKPKLFKRSALDRLSLTVDDWFLDAEILIQARRYGLSVVEIPTVFNKLEGRASFVKPVTIFEFLRNMALFRVREFFK
jgi:glycosyltransferase involved in cell wall biosynthesis